MFFYNQKFREIFIGYKICMIYSELNITPKAATKKKINTCPPVPTVHAPRHHPVYTQYLNHLSKKKTFNREFVLQNEFQFLRKLRLYWIIECRRGSLRDV